MHLKSPHYHCTQLYHLVTHMCVPQTQHLSTGCGPNWALFLPSLPSATPIYTHPALLSLSWVLVISGPPSPLWRGRPFSHHICVLTRAGRLRGSCSRAQLPTVATWEQVWKDHELCRQTWHLSKHLWASISFTVKGGNNDAFHKVAPRIEEMINDKIICKREDSSPLAWVCALP